MIIYLMRHGETDLNRGIRLQGSTDAPLNEKGMQQAIAAGERIREKGLVFDHIITSPLQRAVRTAELATGLDRSGFEVEPRVREMDYGPYDGKKILRLNLKVLSFLRAPHRKPTPPGIESVDAVYERVADFLNEMRQRTDHDAVLVVTHGIAMHVMMGVLQGLTSEEIWKDRFSIENCAVYRTEVTETGFAEPVLV